MYVKVYVLIIIIGNNEINNDFMWIVMNKDVWFFIFSIGGF